MRIPLLLLVAVLLAAPAFAQSRVQLVVTDGNANRPTYVPVRLQQGRVVVDAEAGAPALAATDLGVLFGEAAGASGDVRTGDGDAPSSIAHLAGDPRVALGVAETTPFEAVCDGSNSCGDLRWRCGAEDGCACAIVVSQGETCSLPIVPAAALGGASLAADARELPRRLTVYGWDPASAEARILIRHEDVELVIEPGGADANGDLFVVRD